jgi:hypothetical protein
MTAYYVASNGNNSDGLTWAKAFTTFAGAVTAATGDGDIIYVDQGFTDTLSANAVYTFANNVNVICSNDNVNAPPQTLGTMGTSNSIGHTSTSYSIQLAGAYRVSIRGITFRTAGTGGSTATISINVTDGGHFELVGCYLWIGSNSSAATLTIGNSGTGVNGYTKFTDCIVRFAHASQGISVSSSFDWEMGSVSSDSTAPTALFLASYRSPSTRVVGVDLSKVTGTLVANQSITNHFVAFVNCKIGSGVTVAAFAAPLNKSTAQVYLYNCSSGDEHYTMAHYDAFGETTVATGIYANDGALYDGTNRCSWKIVTTANCSYYTPYVSPWIDVYHSGTSAITPSLEIVRSGSATAYQDDEVWGEFSYQGTSGFPLATIVSDRKALLAAAADQATGALGAGDWTGENATSWFGKLHLESASAITPAEIGHLRARVCVGEPSITVYLDPTIRGRS